MFLQLEHTNGLEDENSFFVGGVRPISYCFGRIIFRESNQRRLP